MEDILNIIKQTGYWRVLIRPLKYDENLINDKKDCWDIIKKAKVSFRGWDFPHVDRENKTNINNGIQSSTDFYDLKEYWKFFQTGQFIHMSAIREDYMKDKIEEQGGDPIPLIKNENKNYKYLSIEILIYRITEIFEFTSRLINLNILEPTFQISISINGLSNRILFFFQRDRTLDEIYKCSTDNIIYDKEFNANEFLTKKNQLSIECCDYFFEFFNFYLSHGIIKEIQGNIEK